MTNPLNAAYDKNISQQFSGQCTSSAYYKLVKNTKDYIKNRMLKLKLSVREKMQNRPPV